MSLGEVRPGSSRGRSPLAQTIGGAPLRAARGMSPDEFVKELDARNEAILRRLQPDATLRPEVSGDLNVVNLLKVALKNEIEATEIAARWLVTSDDVDVKMALARQAGDE